MMYDDAGWGWWLMGAVVLVVLLIVVAGTVAVALAVRVRPGQAGAMTEQAPPQVSGRPPQPSAAALEELDVRFARGEVDEDTYRRSRDLLTRHPEW